MEHQIGVLFVAFTTKHFVTVLVISTMGCSSQIFVFKF